MRKRGNSRAQRRPIRHTRAIAGSRSRVGGRALGEDPSLAARYHRPQRDRGSLDLSSGGKTSPSNTATRAGPRQKTPENSLRSETKTERSPMAPSNRPGRRCHSWMGPLGPFLVVRFQRCSQSSAILHHRVDISERIACTCSQPIRAACNHQSCRAHVDTRHI